MQAGCSITLAMMIGPLLAAGAQEAERREAMTVSTRTSQLRVYVQGEGGEDTVLLLHGGPGVPDYLQPVTVLLPGRFRTVRFDQRGTGGSAVTSGGFRPEEYIADIDAVLDALGVRQAHLFGHSWGGLLAQLYAAYRPGRVKSLFLASPSSGSGQAWSEMEKEVMAYNRRQATTAEWLGAGLDSLLGMLGSDRAYRRMFRRVWSYYFRDPRSAPPADKRWLAGIGAEAVNATRRGIAGLQGAGWEARLGELRIPVLITYGAYDIYGESRQLSFKRWPGARQVLMARAGHLPWVQDREAFLQVLRGFYGD
jgi:proline iminopeptidase